MADGLASLRQTSFAAGMWRATARNLMDERSAWLMRNLLLDDDGVPYLRGGVEFKSEATDGTSFATGLTWVWDGYLVPGQRTIVASQSAIGLLDADDVGITKIADVGLPNPPSHAIVGGLLVIGRAQGAKLYGGSRMTSNVNTTVTVANGSAVVSGSGMGSVDAGALMRVDGGRVYVVKSVQSAAQVTLNETYTEGPQTGPAVFSALADAGTLYRSAELYETVADRLISLNRDEIRFSNGRNDDTGAPQPYRFGENDVQRITDGGVLLGAAELRGVLLAFATNGVWGVYNLDRDLIDAVGNPQQRVERISHDLILWGHAGIAARDNALVVPATDGLWLMDGASAPERLSRSITPYWIDLVRRGYRPGRAMVFRGHYLLPVLDVGNAVREFLVCRLDRAMSTDIGTVYPWTTLRGMGAQVSALAVRGNSLELLGADVVSGTGRARVTSMGRMFGPDRVRLTDADGSSLEVKLITRDAQTGPGNTNLVRGFELDYDLVDGTDITGYVSTTVDVNSTPQWGTMVWGAFTWTSAEDAEFDTLTGAAATEPTKPKRWRFNRRGRLVRYKLTASEACAKLRLRATRSLIRQSAKDS